MEPGSSPSCAFRIGPSVRGQRARYSIIPMARLQTEPPPSISRSLLTNASCAPQSALLCDRAPIRRGPILAADPSRVRAVRYSQQRGPTSAPHRTAQHSTAQRSCFLPHARTIAPPPHRSPGSGLRRVRQRLASGHRVSLRGSRAKLRSYSRPRHLPSSQTLPALVRCRRIPSRGVNASSAFADCILNLRSRWWCDGWVPSQGSANACIVRYEVHYDRAFTTPPARIPLLFGHPWLASRHVTSRHTARALSLSTRVSGSTRIKECCTVHRCCVGVRAKARLKARVPIAQGRQAARRGVVGGETLTPVSPAQPYLTPPVSSKGKDTYCSTSFPFSKFQQGAAFLACIFWLHSHHHK
jgi:hypothetical protein